MKEIKNVCADGLRIHIKENDVVSEEEYFALICQSGSQQDYKRCGTAHFVEHMLLEGAKRKLSYFPNQCAVQGKTGIDRTVLFLSCKSGYENIKIIFKIYHDIISGENLNKKLVNKIRNDLIFEYNNRVIDNPFFEMYQEVLTFAGITEHMPIGKKNDIMKINFRDLKRYFLLNYKPDNLVLLCSTKMEIERVYSIFNHVFTPTQNFFQNTSKKNISYLNKSKKKFSLKKIASHNNTVHIFVDRSVIQNNLKNDFIQSIIFTIFDEISNEFLQTKVICTEYKIIHFTKKDRFMCFTLVLKNGLDKFMTKLIQVFLYKSQEQLEELIDKIIEFYQNSISCEKEPPNYQLNKMIESYLYNVKIYEKEDIILTLKCLKKQEIIQEWMNIRQQILKHENVYLYQFLK